MDYACGPGGRPDRGPAAAQAVRGAEHGPEPGDARLLQVLQLLRREPADGCWRARASTSRSAHLEVVLPIGISFYTFQSMSYVIDVYRKRHQADPELHRVRDVRLVLPAPGRRADHAADDAAAAGRSAAASSTSSSSTRGAYLIFWGLTKKVVVADNLALIVNDLFGRWQTIDGGLGAAGDLCLRVPDLLRLLGLHRRRPRDRQVPGVRAGPELQPALLRHQPAGLLEPLAHQPLDLAPRLPLHPARRQPRRHAADSTAT